MRTLFALALCVIFLPCFALVEVGTIGKSEPVFESGHTQPPRKQASYNDIIKKTIQARYAVKTKSLSLGHVMGEAKAMNVSMPMVIVGCDRPSRKWLLHYGPYLKSINATGFVVNCDSERQYKALDRGVVIALIPTDGTAFSKRFGISHYPVLISRGGIFQ